MKINPADFSFISSLVRLRAAMELEPGKEYLVEARLGPLAEDLRCSNLQEFVDLLRREKPASPLSGRVVDALTTNETFFFRDFHPFESLKKHLLPNLLESRRHNRQFTIWSAACSTGQEPYSLAMLLCESFPELESWDLRILATDICRSALARARQGRYSKLEVNRGLPAHLLIKHFRSEAGEWLVKDSIRKMVEFREFNLAGDWFGLPLFDLILIRNVLIYMSAETRQQILRNMAGQLRDDGVLLLGSAESMLGLDTGFKSVQTGESIFYVKSEAFLPV